MTVRLENKTGGGHAILGVSGPFKVNPGFSSYRRRRSQPVWHLSTSKIEVLEVFATFTAMFKGTRVDPGEFEYYSRDKILYIVNAEAASGIAPDPEGSFAIPISYQPREGIVLSNIYPMPEPI